MSDSTVPAVRAEQHAPLNGKDIPMTYKIMDIQGIGPEFNQKLTTLNIHTTDELLKHTMNGTNFKTLVEKTGISEKLFEQWTRMSLLMRVNGIGPQYAELLYFSGVDTVEKLRDKPAEDLIRKLAEVNATRNLTNALPSVVDVQRWVEQIRNMPTPEPVHVR